MKHLVILLGVLFPLLAQADEAAIRKALTERYPGIEIGTVAPSPIPGLLEVFANGEIIYVNETGDYLLPGPLIDTRSKTNLTRKRMEQMPQLDFSSLPLDKAIKITRGKGERRLAVFSDPECPFCKKLERELAQVDNVKLYIFPYPLVELHPRALAISKAIWCAPDKAQAWQDYLIEGKAPPESKDCDNPVESIMALGRRLGINGTPALIFSNGVRRNGAVPAAEIEKLLNAGT